MIIYLAGSVPKGDKEQEAFHDWRKRYREVLNTYFLAEYIDPYDRNLDEADSLLVVGKDCTDIINSALVIVNAEDKLGAGTAQEMVIAKYLKKPIVTVLPKNSPHRRSNILFRGQMIEEWFHPFVFSFSDFVIEHIGEIQAVKDILLDPSFAAKDISLIDEAIRYFGSKSNLVQSPKN